MVQHTAIWYYKNDEKVMSHIKGENPNLSTKELKSLLTQQWKKLTPNDKTPFERMVILSKEEALDLELDEVPPMIYNNKDSSNSLLDDLLVEDSLVEDSLVKDSPVEDSPVKDSLVKESLVEDSVVNDTCKEQTNHLSSPCNNSDSDNKLYNDKQLKQNEENLVLVDNKSNKDNKERDDIANSLSAIKIQLTNLERKIKQLSQ